MPQQINLYDEALRPRRERWRAVHGLWVVAAVLLVAGGLSYSLQSVARQRAEAAAQLERQMNSERELQARNGGIASGPSGAPPADAELERLRQLDASQRRVQQLLDAQLGSGSPGYTPFFLALSRQAHGALWITGFAVSADGGALEIQGRMTDASVLPDYLRRLNTEPQFRGRRFEQLSLRTLGDGEGAGLTEFVLRSQPLSGAAATGAVVAAAGGLAR